MSKEPSFVFECYDHEYAMYEYSRGWWTYTTLECVNERCAWIGFSNRRFRWNIFS